MFSVCIRNGSCPQEPLLVGVEMAVKEGGIPSWKEAFRTEDPGRLTRTQIL